MHGLCAMTRYELNSVLLAQAHPMHDDETSAYSNYLLPIVFLLIVQVHSVGYSIVIYSTARWKKTCNCFVCMYLESHLMLHAPLLPHLFYLLISTSVVRQYVNWQHFCHLCRVK